MPIRPVLSVKAALNGAYMPLPHLPLALVGVRSITPPIDANRRPAAWKEADASGGPCGPFEDEMRAAPLALNNDVTLGPGPVWRAKAACRGLYTGIFFPLTDEAAEPAKAICASCPVREQCLEYVLDTRQEDGLWHRCVVPASVRRSAISVVVALLWVRSP